MPKRMQHSTILDASMRAVLSNTQDMMFIKDADFVYIGASRPFAQMLGMEPAELVGKTDFEIFADQELARRYRADDERLMAKGEDLLSFVEPLPSPDGGARYSSTSKYIIRNNDGKPIGLCGVSRDITWEYSAKLEHEKSMQSLFSLPADGVCAYYVDVEDWRLVDSRMRDENGTVVQDFKSIDAFGVDGLNCVHEGEEARSFFQDFSRESLQRLYEQKGEFHRFSFLFRFKGADPIWAEQQIYFLHDPVSQHFSALLLLRNVDTLKRTEVALLREAEAGEAPGAYCGALHGPVLCSRILEGEKAEPLYWVSDGLIGLLGYTRAEFEAAFADDVYSDLSPQDAEQMKKGVSEAVSTRRDSAASVSMRRPDGMLLWVEDSIRAVRLPGGEEIAIHVLSDVTELHESRQSAEMLAEMLAAQREAFARAAEQDAMTGLMTRVATMRQIESFLCGEGAGGRHALFIVDADDFKEINKRFGHQMGDKTITEMAKIVKRLFRKEDIVGRIGGDEFFALMKHVPDDETILEQADKLLVGIRRSFEVGGHTLEITGSIGISLWENGDKSLDQFFSEAENAIKEAKRQGKNRCVMAGMENFVAQDTETSDTAGRTLQLLVQKLLRTDYDFLGLLSRRTGRVTIYGNSGQGPQERLTFHGDIDYDATISRVFGGYIREDYYEESLRALCHKTIVEKLEGNENYICQFPTRKRHGAQQSFAQWKCTYLDSARENILIVRNDVSEAVSAERDALTGLFNRQGFYKRVRARLDDMPEMAYSILYFDLDNFKIINETLGMEKGDDFLSGVAQSLRQEGGADAICARLDADHFAVLLPAGGVSETELFEALSRYLESYAFSFPLKAHMGVYRVDDRSLRVPGMCDRALMALQSVKNNQTARVAHYDESLYEKMLQEQLLAGELRTGIEENQFDVYFQPQINYAEGCMVGAEALVRWQHPERGLIMPGAFIPLFERNGLISLLDAYVWEKCCMYLRRWADMGMEDIAISTNISRVDMYDANLSSKLRGLVEKYDIPASRLKLEITESAYMEDPGQLISIVQELREIGFIVEMDDFGAGYSSLNTLKDVPVDVLKLDMRFLAESTNTERGGNILASVIRMAHWLNLPVIAEGVETKAQADYLKSLSCFYMQGYYFYRPMPAAQFEALLQEAALGAMDRLRDASLEGMAEFWDPSAQTALLFNSYVGGAAILEYAGDEAEILRANDKFYELLNTTREEALAWSTRLLGGFAGEHRNAFRAMLEEAIQTGQEAECDTLAHRKQAGYKSQWMHNRVRLLARSTGRYLFYLAVEDISARVELQEELRLSKEAFALSLSRAGRVVNTFDVESRTMHLPEDFAKQRGIPAVLPDTPYNCPFIRPEDRDKYISLFEEILMGEKQGRALLRTMVKDSDREYLWEMVDYVTTFSKSGRPVQALITVRDVSDRVAREIDTARLHMVLENMGTAAFSYDVSSDRYELERYEEGKGVVTIRTERYSASLLEGEGIHPSFRLSMQSLLRRVLRGDIKKGSYTFLSDMWGENWEWTRIHFQAICGEKGDVYHIIGQLVRMEDEPGVPMGE